MRNLKKLKDEFGEINNLEELISMGFSQYFINKYCQDCKLPLNWNCYEKHYYQLNKIKSQYHSTYGK